MITVYRFEQARFADKAYRGFGAKLNSGRWHKSGCEAVYTSSSRSLCVLEILVQVDPEEMPDYVCVPAQIPKDVWSKREVFGAATLPAGWRSYPPPPALAHLGSRWFEDARTAILEVPSAVMPEEANYILNPNHADFKKIVVGGSEPFTFDPRLLK